MGRSSAGGGSGGGRSFGGGSGGSRSFGGRSSSSRSSRGSGGSRSYGGGGVNIYNTTVYRGSSSGQLSDAGAIVYIIAMLLIAIMTVGSIISPSGVTKSTMNRERLSSDLCTTTDFYVDRAGWFGNGRTLTKGMQEFYNKTGVQPVLVVTESLDGKSAEEYMTNIYDEMISDEGHVMIMYHDQGAGNYSTYYLVGNNAKMVIDNEAADIILDYIDVYSTSDMSDEKFFSTVFSKSADRIMKKTTTVFDILKIVVIGIIIVAVVIIGAIFKLQRHVQKLQEMQEAEKILNSDL